MCVGDWSSDVCSSDLEMKNMKVYHCGASSKDAGKKLTTITELKEKEVYRDIMKEYLGNPQLVLK